jgi:AcrR family transcriptional regulator
MPRLIDSSSRADAMVEGVNRVLVTRGVFGLTLRSIADESRISTGSLLHHFGSRERVLIVAAGRTGRRFLEAIEAETWTVGVEAFLPGDDEMVLLTRAWLRSAVCAPLNPMPPRRARQLLRTASSAALARAG